MIGVSMRVTPNRFGSGSGSASLPYSDKSPAPIAMPARVAGININANGFPERVCVVGSAS